MTAFLLTRPESWTLCTLFHLPVQPGSAMSHWLGSGAPGDALGSATQSLDSLANKGYYFAADTEQPFPPALLPALGLVSVNAAELTVIIRRSGQVSLTRFAQVGNGVVQFGMNEEHLALHPVTTLKNAADSLIPKWFTVTVNQPARAELPLGEFLLFKQACAFADLAAAASGFQSETFRASELLKQFAIAASWVDIFNAEGVRGVPAVEQMPLQDYLDHLVSTRYLQSVGANMLAIGASGKPLAATLSDPDLCSLTLSLQIWEGGFPETGGFLYGAGQLFMVSAKPGMVFLQQLASPQAGSLWVENLMSKGSRARYGNYVLAPADALPS